MISPVPSLVEGLPPLEPRRSETSYGHYPKSLALEGSSVPNGTFFRDLGYGLGASFMAYR